MDQQTLEVGKFLLELAKVCVLPAVVAIVRKLDALAKGQVEIKAALIEMNTWREGHDKQDDGRHRDVTDDVNEIRGWLTGGRVSKVLLIAGFCIAAAAASAWGQTATPSPTITPTATATATPCENVEIENISLPPLVHPFTVLGGQDVIVVSPSLAAGTIAPLTLRFVNRRCISRGRDGDRENQTCFSDEDCPTLGVTVPYTCVKRLRAPETLDYSVIDTATGTVITAATPVTVAERSIIFLAGQETAPLDDPPVDTRFRRRVRLSWSFPCGASARDVEIEFRQVHASTPTPSRTPTSSPIVTP